MAKIIENEGKVFIIGAAEGYRDMMHDIFSDIKMADAAKYNNENDVIIKHTKTERFTFKVKGEKKKFRVCTPLNGDYKTVPMPMYSVCMKTPIEKDSDINDEYTVETPSLDLIEMFIGKSFLDAKKVYEGNKFRTKVQLNHKDLELALDEWVSGPLKGIIFFELESNDKNIDIKKEMHRLFYDWDYEIHIKGTMKLVKEVKQFAKICHIDPTAMSMETLEELVEEDK